MSKFFPIIHRVMSQRLMLPLSRVQRLARPSRRAVIQAYYNGIAFRRTALNWTVEKKLDWVLHRLRFVVRRAYNESEYYRKQFDRIGFDPRTDFSFDEFGDLPVLERADVLNAADTLLSRNLPISEMLPDSTGGSTGAPTQIWLGPEERGWKESAGEFFMERLGVPAGVRTALLWGHHLDPNANDSLRDRFYAFETNMRFFDCLRMSSQILEKYHREFQRWQPECIIAYASALGHFAEYLIEHGYRGNYPIRCLVTGAEKLLPQHREAIERAFGHPVHERYGGRDVGYVAFQMNPNRDLAFEVDWPNVLVEPEENHGESNLLVTKLHADAMPMIRYRVGDVARFLPGSKPGHPALFLNEIIGRDVDRIWLPDGRWITGLQIPHMMKDYPVREYRFHQLQDYSVVIQIAPKDGFDETSRSKILETIRINLPGLAISTIMVDAVSRTAANKWRPVISDVDPGRGQAA